MEQKTDRLNPTTPLEKKNIVLEHRLDGNWMMWTASIPEIRTIRKRLPTSKIKIVIQKRIKTLTSIVEAANFCWNFLYPIISQQNNIQDNIEKV